MAIQAEARPPEEAVVKSGRIDEACRRYGLGKISMRKLAEEANAGMKVGKSYIVSFDKVDAYIVEHSR